MNFSPEVQQEISQKLVELETLRKEKLRSFKLYERLTGPIKLLRIPLSILLLLGMLVPFLMPLCFPLIAVGFALLAVRFLLYYCVFKCPEEQFQKAFKQQVMTLIMNKINPTFSYSPEEHLGVEQIQNMHLFDRTIDWCKGEDYVEGRIGKVDIKFSENELKKAKSYGEDKTYETFFKGLIMQADFHKAFNGSVLIAPTETAKTFIFSKSKFKGQKRVNLNHPQFDKIFSVFANDELLATYALTPALMERIVSLHKELQAPLYMSLIDGEMNLAVHWPNKDFFEADFYTGVPTLESLQPYFAELQFFEDVIDHLMQNTRIWGEKAVTE